MIARLHIVAELVLIVSVGIAVCVAVLREREHRRPGVLLDLLPPEGATADVRAWVLFFQSLYAIAHPWWKRWLLGQPHIVLELWSEAGAQQRAPRSPASDQSSRTMWGWPSSQRFHQGCAIA